MVDKVKPLGMEIGDTPDGDVPTPRELDPSEDYLAAKGIALENSDNFTIYKSGSLTRVRSNAIDVLDVDADGVLNVRGVTDYETLLIDDDDIPNLKYVNDNDGGINTVALFISDANGENINSGSPMAVSTDSISGPDQYPVTPTYIFGVVANSSSGGTATISLYNVTNAALVGSLVWNNETAPSLKTLSVSIDNGVDLHEIQVSRTNGTGKLFSAVLRVRWG